MTSKKQQAEMKDEKLHLLKWSIRLNPTEPCEMLYAYDGEEPIYYTKFKKSTSKSEIFERVIKDFKLTEVDKPFLLKLLNDFSIKECLSSNISGNFYFFLFKNNFRIELT